MTLFIEQNLHLDKKLNEDRECGADVEWRAGGCPASAPRLTLQCRPARPSKRKSPQVLVEGMFRSYENRRHFRSTGFSCGHCFVHQCTGGRMFYRDNGAAYSSHCLLHNTSRLQC